MSNSLRPHGLQPTRFLCPCYSPGNNRVSCHFLSRGLSQPWDKTHMSYFSHISVLSHFSYVQPSGPKPTKLLCPRDSPSKNTGEGCYALLQGIFLTQGSKLHLLHLLLWESGFLPLAPPGKPSEFWSRGSKYQSLTDCLYILGVVRVRS